MSASQRTPAHVVALFSAASFVAVSLLLGACKGSDASPTPVKSETGAAPKLSAKAARGEQEEAPPKLQQETLDSRRSRARKLFVEGKTDQGLSLLRALWEEAPSEERAGDLVLQAAIQARQGETDAALALIKAAQAAKLSSNSMADLAAAIGTNLSDPGVQCVKLPPKIPPARDATNAAILAHLHERAHDPRGAIPFWEMALRQSPAEPSFLRELVRLYAITADNRQLENSLRQLLVLTPNDLSVRINLVRMLGLAGRMEEARQRATPENKSFSDQERALISGEVFLRARLPKEAKAVYSKMLTGDPELCPAKYGLAIALRDDGDSKASERLLFSLLKARAGTPPCKVAEASRALLMGANAKSNRVRLQGMIKRPKELADIESLQGVLNATQHEPHRQQPPR